MESSDDHAARRTSARAAVVVVVLTVVLLGVLVLAVVTLVPHTRDGSDRTPPIGGARTSISPTDSDISGGAGFFDDELRSAMNPPGLARLPRMSTAPTPGQVVYSLTGEGVVAGVSYATTGLGKFGLLDGPLPWSLAVDVESVPELTATVIDGPITCTIRRDDRVLAEATSSSGELRCRASEG